MRNKNEIEAEIKNVTTKKENAEHRLVRCIERLDELKEELKEELENAKN